MQLCPVLLSLPQPAAAAWLCAQGAARWAEHQQCWVSGPGRIHPPGKGRRVGPAFASHTEAVPLKLAGTSNFQTALHLGLQLETMSILSREQAEKNSLFPLR